MMSYFSEMDGNLFAIILTVITMGFFWSLLYILRCHYVIQSLMKRFRTNQKIFQDIMNDYVLIEMLKTKISKIQQNSAKMHELFDNMCAILASTKSVTHTAKIYTDKNSVSEVGDITSVELSLNDNHYDQNQVMEVVLDISNKVSEQIENTMRAMRDPKLNADITLFKATLATNNKRNQAEWQRFNSMADELCELAKNSTDTILEIQNLIKGRKSQTKRLAHSEHDS